MCFNWEILDWGIFISLLTIPSPFFFFLLMWDHFFLKSSFSTDVVGMNTTLFIVKYHFSFAYSKGRMDFWLTLTLKMRKKRNRHGDLLPASLRAAIVGASNFGEINCLMAFITYPNGLRFEDIYVYSNSLNQPKY